MTEQTDKTPEQARVERKTLRQQNLQNKTDKQVRVDDWLSKNGPQLIISRGPKGR